MGSPYISKSKYIAGLQCGKLLWIHYNAKEQLPPEDEATQAVFDQGHEVGLLAQKLFPGGLAVSGSVPLEESIRETRRLLEERKPLFEAAFSFDGTYARADVLDPVRGGAWDLIEVKSSTEVKDPNTDDASFQLRCYEGAGLRIRKCLLMHIDTEYVRRGEVDPRLLFTREDVTRDARKRAKDIGDRVKEMQGIISRAECPEVAIGPHCSAPFPCRNAPVCWKAVEEIENNVFTLPRIGGKAWDLFAQGIVGNDQIPGPFKLTKSQQIQLEAERSGKPFINRSALKEFLQGLEYPLHFLDFETFQTAIPLVEGTRPYQQVPFQFSLHVADSLDSRPLHHSWLWDGKGDPLGILLERLLPLLGRAGSVVVYNAAFESGRLKECAAAHPRFAKDVEGVLARISDLYAPFRSFDVYYPSQHGSASIKKILPALTGKTYKELSIQDGGRASGEYKWALFGGATAGEREKVLRNLEEYCSLDTMGMLDIARKLRDLAQESRP